MICRSVRVEGRVQGVWYRAWTERAARARGLTGWVRNEPDGSVAALFCGEEEAVEAMIRDCHDGPDHARVARVSVSEAAGPPPAAFMIRR